MPNHLTETLAARVLLVEDDQDCRRYVAQVLEQAGCEVSKASCGEDGIRRGSRGGYDVILADINMPQIDGFELTNALKTVWGARGLAPIPIVALTGHAMAGFGARCLSAGMAECVTKPVSPSVLRDVVRRWSGERGAGIEVPADLADLIPDFLERRRLDVSRIRIALTAGDFETIRSRGHDMKGSGTSYGFDFISRVGGRLEDAATRRDAVEARASTDALDDHLRNLVWITPPG